MIKGNYHRLLKRQIKDQLGEKDQFSRAEIETFLHAINDAYLNFDQDINHIENILKQSSQELFKKNKELNALNATLSKNVEKKTTHLGKVSYNLKTAEKIAKLGNFTWDMESQQLEMSDQLIRMFNDYDIDFSQGIRHIFQNFEGSIQAFHTVIKAIKRRNLL